MTAALRAVAPGPYVTMQDSGRRGWRRFGVAVSGAMDQPALAMANVLVGNPPEATALEFAHVGGSWEVAAASARIAVAGGAFKLTADGAALPSWRSHTLRQGQLLSIGTAGDAVWGYLAVAGGFDVPPQLGSCATHLRSGIGGLGGRLIQAGDELKLHATQAPAALERRLAPRPPDDAPLRVVLGPQDDYFAQETQASFLATPWRVTHRGDRMGTWLEGPRITHAEGFNVLSDGLVPGCVQVPGVGQPVVLMMDCQTIGGYPKLATIITPDLPRFAQSRPGRTVHFTAIGIDEAQEVHRADRCVLDGMLGAVTEIDRRSLPFWLRG